ncbi:MAG: Abi-alpha family protein [Acidimicrobiales bacterium]
MATAVSVSRDLTRNSVSESVATARALATGARQRRSVGDLANLVLAGWARANRNAVEIVQQAVAQTGDTPGAAFVGQVTELAGHATELAEDVVERRPITGRLPGPLSANAAATTSVQDTRRQLRDMGQELLRRSTALDDPDEHPAFRAMLSAMAPDEARIVCLLARRGPQAMLDVVEYNAMKKNSREVSRHVSMIGAEAGCIRPGLASVYVDNLERLGVVHVRDFRVASQEDYDLLYAQPEVDQLPAPEGRFTKRRLLHRGVELSELGRQLYDACFAEG